MDENQESGADLANQPEDTAKLYVIDDDTNEWVDSGCGRVSIMQVLVFSLFSFECRLLYGLYVLFGSIYHSISSIDTFVLCFYE